MGAEHKVIRTILTIERLANSRSGNPRYAFVFKDGGKRLLSTSDAGFAYEVGNPGLREGDRVSITLTRAGRIRDMEPAPACACVGCPNPHACRYVRAWRQ